jgi:hypothetical protein
VLCQLSYSPGLRAAWYPANRAGHGRPYTRDVHRRALGVLFTVLAVGLALIAVFSALEGGRAWVVALAAAALAVWMGDLARRALVRRT